MSTQDLQHKKKRKKQLLDDLEERTEDAIQELEKALDMKIKSDETVKEKVNKVASIYADQYFKEGKTVDQLHDICAKICKRLSPKHTRQIQRSLDDRYKQVGHSSKSATHVVDLETSDDQQALIEDNKAALRQITNSIDNIGITNVRNLLDNIDDFKDLLQKHVEESGISYFDRYKKDDDTNPVGIKDDGSEKEKIRLEPSEISEDERTQAMQRLQAYQYDQVIKIMIILKESIVKYNYTPDNPEINEPVLIEILKTNSRGLHFVHKYFKIYHMLTPEQRKIALPKFLSEIHQMSEKNDSVPLEAGKKELIILALELIKSLKEIDEFLS